jgi:hypothetical protein
MKRKFFISTALLTCLIFAPLGQGAQAINPEITHAAIKPTSISKAKSMIRSLYYGYQQASYKGWTSHKKYIAANNYPGMYSNAKGCLDKLTSYGDVMPDLSTVGRDSSWKLPKGVYQNRLAGKKPAGETFVFQANAGGKQVFNHVTILKGKAYFFLWVCVKSNPVVVDTELAANREYFNAIGALADDENSIINQYSSVTGVNYSSDQAVYSTVINLIPETQIFIASLGGMPTKTTKLYQLNQVYINAWSSYLSAFSTLKTALERQDATLVPIANDYLMEARNFITEFVTSAATFRR